MSAETIKANKEALYGQYMDSQRWRTDWARKAAHQALDLRDDEMQVNSVRNSGITWKEIAAAGAVVLGGLGLYQYMQTPSTQPVVPASIDSDTRYMPGVDREDVP